MEDAGRSPPWRGGPRSSRQFRHHLVERLPVNARDAGDVFGRFEPALDLERGDAGAHEVGQHVEAGEILRAEQVAAVAERHLFAVGNEIVGQAAGLGAFAAVGGAAAERFAGEALAGVGDAERAVDEDLERQRHLGGGLGGVDLRDVGERIFAGEHDELRAELAGELHAGGAGDRHLRGAVDRKIRRERADQPADADVLHDGGVDAGGDDGAQVVLGVGGQFVGEDERVERHVAAHAAAVEKFHQRGQVGRREILRAHPGVEALEAEVDRVGAVLDGGAGAFPVAGGREQFRFGRTVIPRPMAVSDFGCRQLTAAVADARFEVVVAAKMLDLKGEGGGFAQEDEVFVTE